MSRKSPFILIFLIVFVAVALLRLNGRLWYCAANDLAIWAGNVQSAHNSQHLFDPYTFTHVLHGVAFCGLLFLLTKKIGFAWSLVVAVALEAGWELIENSAFVIERYRNATMALGYQGDSITNSISDIFACGFGFWLAHKLGWKLSIALFLLVEIVLIFWIRDSLLLNVLMLLFPVDAIKEWQTAV